MRNALILLTICITTIGCTKESSTPTPEKEQSASQGSLSSEAQSELDRLNEACEDESWLREIKMIEQPETRPQDYIISGEVNGFVLACKERLAKEGVFVKWNPSKQRYEAAKIEQTDTLNGN